MSEQSLNEKVYQQIKQMMFTYEIIPGQKLVIGDIANKLGVSRTPINSALYHLGKEGFLDFVPNQGYTVHQLTKQEVDSLYDLRELLELGAVEKAIANLTRDKLKILKQREESFKKAVAEKVGRGRFLLDQEYHAYLVEMSDNLYIADYYREIYQRIFLRHRLSPLRGERTVHAPAEHHEIYEAIRQRDVNRAKKAISAHIQAGKEYVYSFIFN
jgi:DNA-binding GntR family transcriptional regulator